MTRKTLLFLLALTSPLGIRADAQIEQPERSADGVWERVDERAIPRAGERVVQPRAYATYRLDRLSLDQVLQRAPAEFSLESGAETILPLPMPDGRYARFRIEQAPILSADLAAQFPEIRTYRAQGIDDPTATARIDWTSAGFHAVVFGQRGTVYVDPYMKGDTAHYLSYYKLDLQRQTRDFQCLVGDSLPSASRSDIRTLPLNNGTTLRTYRIAIAATAEYTAAVGGTQAAALAQIATTLNRVNGIYERDLAVRLSLVSGTNTIFTNAATDGYSNNDGNAMLDENQEKLDAVVGSAAYDIGHVFSTGGGGVAQLRSVCSVVRKAMGVTGSSSPTGDGFDVDYVAHEIGHQFGANHTFNGTSASCGGGNRASTHAYEPGSGITVMAYAGICGDENLAAHSIDSFNVGSLDEMTTFLANSSTGASCGTTTATGNTAPTVSAGSSFTIPRSTPFALTATASDPNGDSLTFSWEEFDLGASTSTVTGVTTDNGQPLFRPYAPVTTAARTFPSLTYILNNANVPPSTYTGGLCSGVGTCVTAETLPTTSRTMTFAVVARDNRAASGGTRSSTTTVTVTSGAGPFAVTSPNTAATFAGSSTQTITWTVANTSAAPVSAANVRILLSTDGGTTFGTTLASSTANDGSDSVTIPNTATTTARIRVEAVGNIFFDVSDANFTITQSSGGSSGTGGSSGSSGSGSSGFTTGIVDFTPRALDLNGDGRGDLFSYNQTTGAWRWDLENGALKPLDPTRTLVASTSSSWDGGWTVKAGDFNNDGRADVFLYSATAGRWFKAINNGANNFTYYTEVTTAGYQIAIGNFGGSAASDVFFYNATSGAWSKCVSTGDGTAGFSCDSSSWDPGWQIHPIDSNANGVTDLFLYNPASGVRLNAHPATSGFTYVNSGAWSAGWTIAPGSYDGAAGDDLHLYNSSTGQWFIIGGATLNTVGSGAWSAGWTVKSGDLNGDGRTDVFLYDAATGTWFECFNNGAGDFTYASGRWDPGWQISVTSFNADARADLLLYNPSTGAIVQCINTGSASFTYYAGSIGTGMTVVATRP